MPADAHKRSVLAWAGLKRAHMIKTADRDCCLIAEWSDMEALAQARPAWWRMRWWN